MRIRLALLVLAASAAGVRAEEAFPMSGEVRHDPLRTVFEDRVGLRPVGDRLRVASYNIENFTDGINDGDERTEDLARAQAALAAALIEEIDPDLVMVIEIENGASLQLLNAAMKKPYPAGYITDFGDDKPDQQKLNLAVLTRVPLAELRELDFSPLTGAGRPPRGTLHVQVDLGGKHRLAAYLVHLKSNYGYKPRNLYQRRHAMQLVAKDAKDLLQQKPGTTWEFLVLGDVNVDPEQAQFARDWSMSPLRRGWKDLWRGRPLHERTTLATRYGDPALEFPPACFDRFYAGADLTNLPWKVAEPQVLQKGTHTRDVKVLPGVDGHVSDHYPVYVDILREGVPAP